MSELDPLPRFIAQLIAIVLLSRLIGRATRKLGQPMVVAEITAGILLGPSVLGWLVPSLSTALFAPESLELLHLVSNVGLVLFMFLVGIEFDPQLSRERFRSAVVTSQAAFWVPLGLGILLALHLYDEFAPAEVSPARFAVFMGAVISISAFPVVARILVERRLVRSRLGVVTITSAAIDAVIAWCVVGFVVGWSRTSGLVSATLTTTLALAYTATMIFGVRPLLAWLMRRFWSSSELGHDQVAALLSMLFVSSWITAEIGIHAMFGAFLFGVILPRDGGLAHALADKLEDVAVVVLVPLFFAYSGVRTEIGLLDSTSAWLTCGLIIVIACVGKLGAATLAGRLTGLSWRESGALGILMNTRGLMVLVMLNIGLDLGIIGPTLFTMLVIMALFTTFLATPALDVVYPIGHQAIDLLAAHAVVDEPRRSVHEAGYSVLLCFADAGPSVGLQTLAQLLTDTPEARVHALQLRRPEHAEPQLLATPARPTILGVKPMSFVSSDPVDDICRVAEVKVADLVLLASALDPSSRRLLRECRRDVGLLLEAELGEIAHAVVLNPRGPSGAVVRGLAARLAAAGVDSELRDPTPASVSTLDPRVDLLVVALDDELEQSSPLLDACLAAHERGVALLLIGHQRSPATEMNLDR